MFIAVSIGTYMAALDSSIVNVSMPTITRYFHSDISTTNWVITVYLLTLTGLLLIFGRLADIFSRKKIFSIGMALFTFFSLTCGLAGSLTSLIISRFLQAVGGAMLMSLSPAIITEAFPKNERGKALGAIGTVVALGIMTGAPAGGAIVSMFSWRYIFFINVPVGVIGVILSIIVLEEKAPKTGAPLERFDLIGAFLLLIFLVTFLLALSSGSRSGFYDRTIIIAFMISLIVFIIFIVTQMKARNPTIELHLFRNAGFSSANVTAMITYMAIFMVMFMLPFFLERVARLSPSAIGAILITPTTMLLIFSPLFGWVSDKIGYRFLRCCGLTTMSAALLLLSYITNNTSMLTIVLILFLYGFGIGMFVPPNNSLLMGSVPREKLGVAAGMLATTRNMGMMIGVAASSAIFTYQTKHYSHKMDLDILTVQKTYSPYADVFFAAALVCVIGIVIAWLQGSNHARDI